MIPLLITVILLVGSMGVHEIGHYISAIWYEYEPHFTIHERNPAVKYWVKDGEEETHRGSVVIGLSGSILQTLFLVPVFTFGDFGSAGGFWVSAVAVVASWHYDYWQILRRVIKYSKSREEKG